MSRHGKKRALIKLLYHCYLQAILQQEHIEGQCFHKRLCPRGLYTIRDVEDHSYSALEEASAEHPLLENMSKGQGRATVTPIGDSVTSVSAGEGTDVQLMCPDEALYTQFSTFLCLSPPYRVDTNFAL